ncbi:hypothetical protein B0H19DRAFT_1260781 [Mycena capillaripes]|nr:hypothetical protein B0H19DRAFT_1260781 [Mycena capillaripes]
MTPSIAVQTALEVTEAGLTVMANAAQLAPIPYAFQVIWLAQSILGTIQRVRNNKKGFRQLEKDIGELYRAIIDSESRVQSLEMKQSLSELLSLLTKINKFVLKRTAGNTIYRILTSRMDASKIQDYRVQIRQALDVFALKTQINIHENTEWILKEVLTRGVDAPTTATSPVSDPPGVTNSPNTTVGKFLNCVIAGPITVTTINGDCTEPTVYH